MSVELRRFPKMAVCESADEQRQLQDFPLGGYTACQNWASVCVSEDVFRELDWSWLILSQPVLNLHSVLLPFFLQRIGLTLKGCMLKVWDMFNPALYILCHSHIPLNPVCSVSSLAFVLHSVVVFILFKNLHFYIPEVPTKQYMEHSEILSLVLWPHIAPWFGSTCRFQLLGKWWRNLFSSLLGLLEVFLIILNYFNLNVMRVKCMR